MRRGQAPQTPPEERSSRMRLGAGRTKLSRNARWVAPASTTSLGPILSLKAPQPQPARPMIGKPIVIALETPASDQPIVCEIAGLITGSENIAPMATQVISRPQPTITQP